MSLVVFVTLVALASTVLNDPPTLVSIEVKVLLPSLPATLAAP